jgi:hypothetical protein
MIRTARRSHQFARSILHLDRLEDRTVPSAVIRWNNLMLDASLADHALGGPGLNGGPTRTSRAFAIVQAAVYDAVNSIDRSYMPYKVEVPAPRNASIPAAVAQAAHDTLVALYPYLTTTFNTALNQDLAAIPNSPSKTAGITVGQQVAAQILAIRANDHANDPMPYTPTNLPGYWQPDPLNPGQVALTPGWGNVTPFTMNSGSQFRAAPPPALNSPEYTAAYNELLELGGDGITTPTSRTEEQTEIGIFWGYDGTPGLCTPPRLYNQITQVIANQKGNNDVQNARLFALVNLAQADAGIAGWESKYFYDLWRPVTGIREGDLDGNPNTIGIPNWSPLGAPGSNGVAMNFTPPFPAYVSGHATFGAAAMKTIALFYGTDHIPFTFVSDELNGVTFDQFGMTRPLRPRSFQTLSQAIEENGQSRIYLGIHWSFDKTEGIKQGNAIADWTFTHALRARPKIQRFAVGADFGGGPHVKVFDSATGAQLASFYAYDANFRGGVRVTMGDVNGDGVPDVITGAGPTGGPHVKVFDGNTFAEIRSFFAYDASFRGGVYVAAGDLNNDGFDDIITGADQGGGPHVRAFSGTNLAQLQSFFAYGSAFLGGVRVAAGDVDGDGHDDIITGAGPGGGPHVTAVSGANGALLASFYAYDVGFRGGVYVAAGDCDADGKADIVTGAGAGGGPHVQVWNGRGQLLQSFLAFQPALTVTTRGVRVSCTDFNGDGRADLLLGAGAGDAPLVECRDAVNLNQLERALKYDPSFLGGVNVGGY